MGQAGQKIKRKLQQIGYEGLHNSYQKGEDNIFRSQSSSTVLKRITVLLNANQVDSYLHHLQFRKMHKELVQIKYVDLKSQQTDYCKLHIYIENMSLRLSQTFSFHFNNMVKVLYQSLKGFKILYERYGYFTVDASLISISDEGMVKCWMNQKYSISTPKPSFSYKKVTKGQASMVQQLKEVFNCQVDKTTLPLKFSLQGKSFSELISQLQQKFGQQFINSKLDLSYPIPKETVLHEHLSTAPSSYRSPEHKISSGTQIRFNYQMKQPAQPAIRITFNNNKSVEIARGASTSLQKNQKTKINFSYQHKTPTQKPLQKSLIYDLQNTKADEIVNNQNKRVGIQGQ